MRLCTPAERHIRPECFRISRPKVSDLAALPVEIAAELARYINNPAASAVIPHYHHIVLDPHVVRAAFWNRVLGDFAGAASVRDVDHVDDAAGRNPLLVEEIELCGKYFVPDKNIVLVAKDCVGSRQPSVAIQLVVIETELADEFWGFGSPALNAGS